MQLSLEDIIHKMKTGPMQDIESGKSELLSEIINKIDKPILKGLAQDVATVLTNWFEDPKIICCLIQGLWSIYATDKMKKDLNARKSMSVSNTDFTDFLDMLITFIDLIIVILTNGIKKLVFMIPDILKEIMYGVMGSVLIVLQQTMYALRDSAIASIIRWIDNSVAGVNGDSIWAKCLPLSQFLDIVKKYVSDYGLLSEIDEKIKGYIASMHNRFGLQKKLNLPQSAKDLEFLYWFRNLLINMKEATLNFELCIPFQYDPSASSDSNIPNNSNYSNEQPFNNNGYNLTPSNLGIKMSSDGTILVDKQTVNTLPLLSNSSIRGFLNKYYGYPLDVVDSLLVGSSPKDSIIGTDINSNNISDLNADCPNTPSPEEIMKWALNIRNRVK